MAAAHDAGAAPPTVLALLDDAGAGAALLEISSTLARSLRRELSVVYVESTRSLVAAALPFTQVLPASGSRWLPLQPDDVEQGFRAHAARLRNMAARYALREAVAWSLRVMRGSLPDAALDLSAGADLLLLANAPTIRAPATTLRRPHRPRITVLGDGDAASQRALRVAGQLAEALSGVVEVAHDDARASLLDQPEALAALTRCDVLVLPRAPLDAPTLALLRCPVVLVG
ncbi:MAG: hypothetical protein H6R06_519 [Proteobacteria bacterium]|jgi:hypothetical protein|nr:hypothetical protein [Pseudomonadota bacterium]